jgi:hypothetical protein
MCFWASSKRWAADLSCDSDSAGLNEEQMKEGGRGGGAEFQTFKEELRFADPKEDLSSCEIFELLERFDLLDCGFTNEMNYYTNALAATEKDLGSC